MSSAVTTPQGAPVALVERFNKAIGQQVRDLLPAHVAPDRFFRSLAFAVSQNKRLMEMAQQSIAKVAIPAVRAAELGLVISGALGEAYLVPYGDDVAMIPGYKGLISLARRGGDIKQIVARVVYKGESFSYNEAREFPIEHEPDFDAETEGERRFPYAIATFNGGGQQALVMPRWKVLRIQNASLSRLKDWQRAKSPWTTETGEMWKKTAVRALVKMLPISTEKLQRALEMDDEASRMRGEAIDAEAELLPEDGDVPEAPVSPAEQIKADLRARKGKAAQAEAPVNLDSEPQS
jgi:recombination protein RecT